MNLVMSQNPLYDTIHYSVVFDIRWFKDGPQNKMACIQTTRKLPKGIMDGFFK